MEKISEHFCLILDILKEIVLTKIYSSFYFRQLKPLDSLLHTLLSKSYFKKAKYL